MDQEIYKNVYKEVDERLVEIFEEFSNTRQILQNDLRFVRTRLLISFSLLEIICNLYNTYFDLHLNNKALLEKWLKEYCLTDRNPTYKNHPYFKMITDGHLYKF